MNGERVYSSDILAFRDKKSPRVKKLLITRDLDEEDITFGDRISIAVDTHKEKDGVETKRLRTAEISEDPYADFSRSIRKPVFPNDAGIKGDVSGYPSSAIVEKIVVLPRNPECPEEPVVVEFHLHEPRRMRYAYYRNGKGWIIEMKQTIEDGFILDTAFRDFWCGDVPGKDFVALPLFPSVTRYQKDWKNDYRRMDKATRRRLLEQVRGTTEPNR